MRKIILTAAILGLSSTMALAQSTATFADVDTDTSGDVSLVELQAFWPDFTQENFTAADTDASGGLSSDEVAAIGAGMTIDPADPAASTGAGSVGNPSGTDGTPADDDDEDSTMGDTEGTESLSPTTGD